MNRYALSALVVCVCVHCKSAPEPVRAAPATVEKTPTPPPEPVVELPAVTPLPSLPGGLPAVNAPESNPLTAERADLGYRLFFDKRLSKDESMACAACHIPEKAYTSGNALDPKVGGAMNKRNSPTVMNLASHGAYYWDGRAPTLEAVSAAAWKGQLGADAVEVSRRLNLVPTYKQMFIRAFGEPASPQNVPMAFASFFRALHAGNSAWDRFSAGDTAALSKEAQHGYKVFADGGCVTCHTPPLFSDSDFHNSGLGGEDPGHFDATKDERDRGKFKTPSLRNVMKTAPYFHDGSAATIEAAISYMAAGGKKPGMDPNFRTLKLSAKDMTDLKLFLDALSSDGTYSVVPTLP